jgi:hypothetical protein
VHFSYSQRLQARRLGCRIAGGALYSRERQPFGLLQTKVTGVTDVKGNRTTETLGGKSLLSVSVTARLVTVEFVGRA